MSMRTTSSRSSLLTHIACVLHVLIVELSWIFSQVYSADGQRPIGKIAKKFSGFVKEMLTTADNFIVSCKYNTVSVDACIGQHIEIM